MDTRKLFHVYEAWGCTDVVEVTEVDRAETDERFILSLAHTQPLPPDPLWQQLEDAAIEADATAARQFEESVWTS